jgi:regulator of sigma E protease
MLAALDPMGVVMTFVGLGALIFFHELGHFVACRLTGTRVEVFSIGFGPKIVGWRRGKTFYKLAAIPLGGYVKMAAENPGDENTGAPDEFPNKSFLQRLFIMSNGVIFNALLALIFYIWAFGIGVPFPRAEIGDITPGGAGWEAGLKRGDLVTKVNGRPALGFDDVHTEVAFSGTDETLLFTVERDGKVLELPVTPRYSEELGMPEIGVGVAYDREMKGVDKDAPLAGQGGRAGDVVLSVGERSTRGVSDVRDAVNRAAGTAARDAKEIALKARVRRADGSEEELAVTVPLGDAPQLGILPYSGNTILKVANGAGGFLRIGDRLLAVDGRPVDDLGTFRDIASPVRAVGAVEVLRDTKRLTLKPSAPLLERDLADSICGLTGLRSNRAAPRNGMPADRAGMRAGDRILRVGATPMAQWTDVQEAIRANGMKPVEVTVLRGEEKKEITLTIEPARRAEYPAMGYVVARTLRIHQETNLLGTLRTGWNRTVMSVKAVALTIRGLITRRVSARHIGGPIALAEATYRMLDLGWARYLYILALISINLAILNILPIPVLDGGQIVLLGAEKLRGKPLPERVVGYLQLVGLALILGLLVLAFHNDIVRLLG